MYFFSNRTIAIAAARGCWHRDEDAIIAWAINKKMPTFSSRSSKSFSFGCDSDFPAAVKNLSLEQQQHIFSGTIYTHSARNERRGYNAKIHWSVTVCVHVHTELGDPFRSMTRDIVHWFEWDFRIPETFEAFSPNGKSPLDLDSLKNDDDKELWLIRVPDNVSILSTEGTAEILNVKTVDIY